ncbi:MAG: hypothetical protein H0T50_10175 [Gemmatimonadales bacterium]|nr:hypothetical protein [Gemmatimonadales bacterium]MBA3555336.1 hypothetical protein [Gemmatimonadales bacterium]
MTSAVLSARRAMWTPARALLFGGLTVGVLDALDALIIFGLRGVPPARVFQGIASGLLGRVAFEGGLATALLGVLLHFFIAFVVVAIYHASARRLPVLAFRPWLVGPLYGLLVYAVMNLIVIPLSAIAPGPRSAGALLNGLLIHGFGVGLPAALSARAALVASDAARASAPAT